MERKGCKHEECGSQQKDCGKAQTLWHMSVGVRAHGEKSIDGGVEDEGVSEKFDWWKPKMAIAIVKSLAIFEQVKH